MSKDQTLDSNVKIEEAILALQREQTDENLAVVLTIIRQRMKENGYFIVAIDGGSDSVANAFSLRTLTTSDGKKWFYAYTSYEEQFKGNNKVMSGFTSEISKLFELTLHTSDIDGLILNPWGRVLKMNKELLGIIIG